MNILYILISCVLYTLSFPKFNLWFLSFFALTPLFVVLDKDDSLFKQVEYGILWGVSISGGMGYWVLLTLINHYGVGLPKAVLFFGLCLVLPVILLYTGFVLAYRFLHKDHLFFYFLVVPSLWVLFEYGKEVIPVMVPWGGIGYPLVFFKSFIQVADTVGIYGVTFLVVAVNSLLACFLKRAMTSEKERREMETGKGEWWVRAVLPVFFAVTVVALPAVYGKIEAHSFRLIPNHNFSKNPAISSVLIQGNFSSEDRWSGTGFYGRLRRYLEMTGTGEGGGKRVIVWPETVLNSSKGINEDLFLRIISFIGKDAMLVSGGLYRDVQTNSVFNCAYILSGTGRLVRYDKHILLPYAETSPLIDLLDRYYTAPSEFAAGKTPVCMETPIGGVGVSICFELLYPGFVARSVRDGAGFLVNISNDAWFGRSPMPYFHLNAARVRAIENRRFLLRASNSGISAIISPDGNIIAQSRLFTRELIVGKFLPLDRVTLYSRYGNLILYFAMFILLAALLQVVLKHDW